MSGPPRPFVALPIACLDDPRLDGDAIRLLAHYIRSVGWGGRRYVKPDADTANAIGLGLTKLRAARRTLEHAGYVRCEARDGMPLSVQLLELHRSPLQQPMGLGPMAATPPQNNEVPHRKTTTPSVKYGAPLGEIRRGSNTNLRSMGDLKTDLPPYLARQERSRRTPLPPLEPRRKTVRPVPRKNSDRESLVARLTRERSG